MYNIREWYWIVGGNEARVYSSREKSFMPSGNPAYQQFLEAGNRATHIDSEESLEQVFASAYPEGWPALFLKNQAAALLAKSDITVIRCFESDILVPEEWSAYRNELREILQTGQGEIPETPEYPSAT